MDKVVSLELNELNFDFIAKYAAMGRLPTFRKLLDEGRLTRTTAEQRYENLEPWIQWPTVYTGKWFKDHGLFHLGDSVRGTTRQIWEELERRNVRVGAVSPMNARNDCAAPAFFLPDPWTETHISAPAPIASLFGAVKSIVNSNSHRGPSVAELWSLLRYGVPQMRLRSYPAYIREVLQARRSKWARSLVLDRLLADVFLNLWKKHKPGYASLFLNAGAHIQHHYMFDSDAYGGEHRNPDWYSSTGTKRDPLLSVYELYDSIVAEFLRDVDARFLITTGLSQLPNPRPYFQYRLVDHDRFLKMAGIVGTTAIPRMSRDFSLMFETDSGVPEAAARLISVQIEGKPMFSVENRGSELFCQINYRGEADGFKQVLVGGVQHDLSNEVCLVSIENGIHQTVGYHIDLGMSPGAANQEDTPLVEIHEKILGLFPQAA